MFSPDFWQNFGFLLEEIRCNLQLSEAMFYLSEDRYIDICR